MWTFYRYELTWLLDGLYNLNTAKQMLYHRNQCLFAFVEYYLQTDGLNDVVTLTISEFQSAFVYLMIKELVKLDTIWASIYFHKDSAQLEKPKMWKNNNNEKRKTRLLIRQHVQRK